MAIGIFTLRQQLRGLLVGNWPNDKTSYVEYLVVGGGGGSSSYQSGGGGGGGVLTGLLPVTPGVSYVTTVGGGGAANSGTGVGANGSNSVLGSVIALGGGYGGRGQTTFTGNAGASGASGGGGGSDGSSGGNLGQGTFGQGNSGGTGFLTSSGAPLYGAGGGGGAGTVGLAGNANAGGRGGSGIASAINGTVTPYAGGGGGAEYGAGGGNPVSGGVGGGGASSATGTGTSGLPNTGGGGGGTGANGFSGGAGGSGVVVISYPDIYPALASTSGSPTVSTSGSGSISFNGSGQYLAAPSGSGFAFGTADFTMEMWVYPTAGNWTSGNFNIMDGSSVNTGSIEQYLNIVRYYNSTTGSGSSLYTTGFGAVTANTWTHLAIVRISGTTYLYKDGVLSTSASDGFNYTTQGRTFAASASGGGQYPGYISNIRIVKGVGVYTGAFTVPAAPLQTSQSAGTNISAVTAAQTSLLLSSISGAYLIDSSANGLAMVATGTPTWNSSSPFATGLGYKNRVYTWTSTGTWAVTV